MTVALPFLKRVWTRPHDAVRASAKPVEVFAPDRWATDLLLQQAAPVFPAVIAPGSVWIVRLQPPSNGAGWVLELVSLVERWLALAGLPWASVLYDGRNYLIRAGAGESMQATSAKH